MKIVEKVKSGVSRVSTVYTENAVYEGTKRGWMAEENKLCTFVNTGESEIDLQKVKMNNDFRGSAKCLNNN